MHIGFKAGIDMQESGAVAIDNKRLLRVPVLLERARQAAGLSDFGDPWFLEPLSQVIDMINAEAGLHSDDEPPVRTIVDSLALRLRRVDYLKRHPQALEEQVAVAGIIIGLPRGGSTLLQRLLSTSSRLNYSAWWELVHPLPLAGEAAGDPSPRIALGKQAEKWLYETWPEMWAMHQVDALAPDEEIMLIDRTPLSLMYSHYFNVPSYMPWLRRQDHSKAYAELMTWFKILQYEKPERRERRWLLKSPHHLLSGGLRTMLTTFPDAKAIMTHRTLESVLISYCSLQRLTISKYSDTFDAKTLGRDAIDVFRSAVDNLVAVRKEFPPDRFIDVQYQDTVSNPFAVYRDTMRALGIEPAEADERAARDWMAANGREKHPAHHYKPEDYGVTREEIARAFADYHQAFVRGV
jgi:hypothetical protein